MILQNLIKLNKNEIPFEPTLVESNMNPGVNNLISLINIPIKLPKLNKKRGTAKINNIDHKTEHE